MTIMDPWKSIAAAMRLQPKMLTAPRQLGKSAALAAAYGGKLHQNIIQSQMGRREHPLQYISAYSFVSWMFGNVALYNTVTKNISEIMRKERVPHTTCTWYRPMDELISAVGSNVVAITWIRRTPKEELELAVATMIMMGKEPVIVRAFQP